MHTVGVESCEFSDIIKSDSDNIVVRRVNKCNEALQNLEVIALNHFSIFSPEFL